MTEINVIAKDLSANPRPLLLIDTCSLLDIVRAPQRNLTATVEAGKRLKSITHEKKVMIFVQDIVSKEWEDNVISAKKDGQKGIDAFRATWEIASGFETEANLSGEAPSLDTLIDNLVNLSKDLLDLAVKLGRDKDGMSWAIDRVAEKRKPSTKGAVKDSYILGHAIQLCRLLSSAYPKSRVFISSNTDDFAEPRSTRFHREIAEEAKNVGLQYAVSLEASLDILKEQDEIPS